MAFTFTEEYRVDYFKKKNLRYKKLEECDLQIVDDLCRNVHFDIGFHNLKLYYETSPNEWSAAFDQDGKAVVASGCNKLSNGVMFAYLITVHEDWRSKGLARALKPDFKSSPIVASSTDNSIRQMMGGDVWLEKRHGLYGLCTRRMAEVQVVPKIPGVLIERLSIEYLDRLLDYDEKLVLVERKEFVKKWCLPADPCHGETVVAIREKDGVCVGYGTMRLFSDYYGIQPLYANNDEIAMAIMVALTKWCLKDDVYLYMPLMASKRAALEFCYSLGMFITGTELRNCSRMAVPYVKSLPMHKVYSVHEYYPI